MITTFYPPYSFGGDAIFVEQLACELAGRGHHVEVIHCEDAYRVLARRDALHAHQEHPGVVVHRLKSPFGWLSPLATQQTGYPFFKSRALRQILDAGFDVINYHNISLVGGPVVRKLVRDMEWQGALTLQAKVDIRDGKPKLLEMNPRLGLRLWFRTELGCNEPLMCLRIARGEEVPQHHYPVGTLLLAPLEDTFRVALDILDALIYRVRTRVLSKRPIDPNNPPRALKELAGAYARDYLGNQTKVFSPYAKYLLDDPLPCFLWWYAWAGFSLRSLWTLGH